MQAFLSLLVVQLVKDFDGVRVGLFRAFSLVEVIHLELKLTVMTDNKLTS